MLQGLFKQPIRLLWVPPPQLMQKEKRVVGDPLVETLPDHAGRPFRILAEQIARHGEEMARSFRDRAERIKDVALVLESGEQPVGEFGIVPSDPTDEVLPQPVSSLARRGVGGDLKTLRQGERFFEEPTGEGFIHCPEGVG
uniref:Uncharacterized protein n=1 Tax=uncultured Acidobacteriota bacterium TaxID=171953 RepID=H5SIT9_9BACT|nr:hypothetical protein HGMM_F34F02C12 [uncultured Acidobacteriota bacterium]